MKALKYTQLIALKQRALGAMLNEAVKLLADALKEQGEEVPPDIIRRDLWEYAVFSTRIQLDEGEADFELAKPNDTAEVLATKYLGYLASQQSKLIMRAWGDVYQLDAEIPTDASSAPDANEGDSKK